MVTMAICIAHTKMAQATCNEGPHKKESRDQGPHKMRITDEGESGVIVCSLLVKYDFIVFPDDFHSLLFADPFNIFQHLVPVCINLCNLY